MVMKSPSTPVGAELLALARESAAKVFDQRARNQKHPHSVTMERHHAKVIRQGDGDDYDCVQSAIVALSATPANTIRADALDPWQPIETAPKDGTPFDAWVPDAFGGRRMCGLSFNRRGQLRQHGLLSAAELPRWPTHWMPLPTPPAIRALASPLPVLGEGDE